MMPRKISRLRGAFSRRIRFLSSTTRKCTISSLLNSARRVKSHRTKVFWAQRPLLRHHRELLVKQEEAAQPSSLQRAALVAARLRWVRVVRARGHERKKKGAKKA